MITLAAAGCVASLLVGHFQKIRFKPFNAATR